MASPRSSSIWRLWAFSSHPAQNGFVLPISHAKKVEIARRSSATGIQRSLGKKDDDDIPPPPPMNMSKLQQKKKKKLYQRDPFVAAMVQCGKDKERKDQKRAKASLFSCKYSCSTTDSQVILKNTRALDPSILTPHRTDV